MHSPQTLPFSSQADSKITERVGPNRGFKGRLALVGILFLTVVIYGFPWFATYSSWKTGLPPIFAPDFFAYLNLSKIFGLSGKGFTDPWYGQPVVPQFNHSIFRYSFVLFHSGLSILHSPIAASVGWSIGWSVLIACSIWILLRDVLKDSSALELFTGTALLMFVSFDALPLEFAVYLHPLNTAIRSSFSLPFIRMFFPQVAIPLLLFYFLNLYRASQTNRIANYSWMFLLQFATFLIFPFATVFMALASALFVLFNFRNCRPQLPKFILVGFLSALIDTGYVIAALQDQGHTSYEAIGLPSIIRINPSQLRPHFGGTVFLLGMCGLLLLLVAKTSAGKLAASLGLANLIMLFSDVAVDPRFLVSHHAGYFVQIALALEIVLIFWGLRPVLSPRMAPLLSIGLAAFAVLNGAWGAWSTVRSHSKTNESFSSFAQVISGLRVGSQDLVVAPAVFVDDVSTTVPLVSTAHVLYTRNAEILLDRTQVNEVQRERQAVYLYLTGHDSKWMAQGLKADPIPPGMLTLANGFTLQNRGSRREVEADIRENLGPFLIQLEKGTVPKFLTTVRRILVVDSVESPLFDESRVKALLGTCALSESEGIRVWSCGTPETEKTAGRP